jgi:hypothetical protein
MTHANQAKLFSPKIEIPIFMVGSDIRKSQFDSKHLILESKKQKQKPDMQMQGLERRNKCTGGKHLSKKQNQKNLFAMKHI